MRIFGGALRMGEVNLPFRHNRITIKLEDHKVLLPLNVNDSIGVKLTARGLAILRDQYRGQVPYEQTEGLTWMPFHSVANIFGSNLRLGIGPDLLPIQPTFYIPRH